MQFPYSCEMSNQRRFHGEGQHREAIFIPFAFSHHDVVGAEVNIFHPQPETLQQPQTGPVQEVAHDPVNSLHRVQQRFHLMFPQHHREALWSFGANDVVYPARVEVKHVTVHEQDGVERLVLRGGTDTLVHGKRRQKLSDLCFSHLCRMTFSVKEHEPPNPVHLGVLRPQAVVPQADRCPYLLE